MADKTLKPSIEGLKSTNFRRLPRTWEAQSARFFFHEIQVQGKVIAQKFCLQFNNAWKPKTGFGETSYF